MVTVHAFHMSLVCAFSDNHCGTGRLLEHQTVFTTTMAAVRVPLSPILAPEHTHSLARSLTHSHTHMRWQAGSRTPVTCVMVTGTTLPSTASSVPTAHAASARPSTPQHRVTAVYTCTTTGFARHAFVTVTTLVAIKCMWVLTMTSPRPSPFLPPPPPSNPQPVPDTEPEGVSGLSCTLFVVGVFGILVSSGFGECTH